MKRCKKLISVAKSISRLQPFLPNTFRQKIFHYIKEVAKLKLLTNDFIFQNLIIKDEELLVKILYLWIEKDPSVSDMFLISNLNIKKFPQSVTLNYFSILIIKIAILSYLKYKNTF